MTGSRDNVAIVGAGPYGLAANQRLRSIGVDTHIFGEEMSFWQNHMPVGMLLRSSWVASNIGSRQGNLTLDAYHEAENLPVERPIPLERFVDYGRWYQRQTAPDIDRRQVREILRSNGHFELTLNDGDTFTAKRVIVAAGLSKFPERPRVFEDLPRRFATHAADHCDLGLFKSKRVAVIGGGQMALEAAAILHELGAETEVIARAPQVRWLLRSSKLHKLPSAALFALYAPTDVGPPGLSWLVALPEIFRRLPFGWQGPLAYRAIRPAGSGWLVPRLKDVAITTGRSVNNADPVDDELRLTLSDGSERRVDHVLMATGYRIDVDRYDFLPKEIAAQVRRLGTYPELNAGFESSVPGLHFVGAPAAISFGPIMRFVSGTWFTSDALERYFRRLKGSI